MTAPSQPGGHHQPDNGQNDATGPLIMSFQEFDADWLTWRAELHRFAAARLQQARVPSGRLDADDVVQATWWVLFTNRERIRIANRYMYAVAADLIQRAARLSRREDNLAPGGEHTPNAGRAASAEEEYLALATRTMVRVAYRELTVSQRYVIRALFEEGQTYKAVAEVLDISIGSVAAHRARGLVKLREALEYIFRSEDEERHGEADGVAHRPSVRQLSSGPTGPIPMLGPPPWWSARWLDEHPVDAAQPPPWDQEPRLEPMLPPWRFPQPEPPVEPPWTFTSSPPPEPQLWWKPRRSPPPGYGRLRRWAWRMTQRLRSPRRHRRQQR